MKIKLLPSNQEIDNDPNKTLLQVCLDNKIELKSICKGVPSCAECRVKVVSGENNLIPPAKAELSLIGTSYYLDGRRLSCQARAFGDVTLDITDHLNKDDNSNKKLRGFRAQGPQVESKAIQGTLVLEESTKAPIQQQGPSGHPGSEQEPSGAQNAKSGQGQRQSQGRNQNRNQGQGGQGQGGQGQNQSQSQNQNRNRNNNRGKDRPRPR